MVSTKPYLVRAIYEWCADQGFTPYLAARVDGATRVPPGYAKDGQIVLNVGSDATNKLEMDNDVVSFQARFNGSVQSILIPMANVLAIYARENGQGMAFEADPDADEAFADVENDVEVRDGAAEDVPDNDRPPPRGGHLKVIK
ncbi:ClpXP protease specificity-enhancing factor [Azoarcus sp. L1K30]|uniref:ClpXP protease specificity-enhancing factor n=1 Tax=Azoarcus sp. L1K30 TaxID=2820277 RepID=UPI001B83E94C|nr:ClpXP protease specificity-enhancing factor [Azoarcus sp. L1K30]MBR0566608.1 ClpXP protease specificity-enhancing factor [Azoarcus sp. L1K30]